MTFNGISHVGLTVSNLAASRDWYTAVLQWQHQGDGESVDTRFSLGQLPDGTRLVLRQHNTAPNGPFDERQPGLDHLSISCTDAADLTDTIERLSAIDGTWSPVAITDYGQVLNLRDPDNIAIELFGPPAG